MSTKNGAGPAHDIVVIGASAGGVEAIIKLLGDLPKSLPATFFIVVHIAPNNRSMLPQILQNRTGFKAVHPRDGEMVERGGVYVAPPDFHVILQDGSIQLQRGPKENRHRPAIDPLFRSAATNFGSRVIGVILTGSLDDGTAGLFTIKRCGGIAVVQHPEDAFAPDMPRSALRFVDVDHCVPLSKMGALLSELIEDPEADTARKKSPDDCPSAPERQFETKLQKQSMTPVEMSERLGPPSGFICPECNGPLWELKSGKYNQFRCLVGHQYSLESFLADEGEALERALWVAVKTLEERVTLLRRLADQARATDQSITAAGFQERAVECESHAENIRRIITSLDVPPQ